jgi:hypothetical protein
MMTATDTGQLNVHVVDDPIDDASVASLVELVDGHQAPLLIDASQARTCWDFEDYMARVENNREIIIITNLLDPFYDTSILTREAARVLGRVKSILESLAVNGAKVFVLCQRRSSDLGTRSHFLASLCASADHVHFRRST